jgi:transcriptional regulator of acetoin/glycerol metabolism
MFLLQHRSGRALPLAPEALETLRGYGWPGNIRELNNVMERLVALHDRGPVTAPMIRQALGDAPGGEAPAEGPFAEIQRALQATRGRQGAAAKLLGISRSTLWRRMKLG